MFHLKHGKMTPTLQDVMILLGLPIDRMTVISTGVYNRIMLYERMIGLTPPSSKSKGVTYVLSQLRRHFRHHQMMVMRRFCGGTKSIMI